METKAKTIKFDEANQSLILKAKVVPIEGFNYKSIADLENLIGFVGTEPKVKVAAGTGKLIIMFGKNEIKDNSVVFRNSYGEVVNVMSYDKAAEIFDIAAQSEFLPEHKNKVIEKVKVIKAKK